MCYIIIAPSFPFLFLHRQAATDDNAIVRRGGSGASFGTYKTAACFWVHVPSFLTCGVRHAASSSPLHTHTHTRVYLFIFIKISALVFRPIVCVLASADPLTRRHVRNLLCFALLCRRRAVVALVVSKSGRGFYRGRGGNNHNYYLDNFTLISAL